MKKLLDTKKQVLNLYKENKTLVNEVDFSLCAVLKVSKSMLLTIDNITNKQHRKIIKLAKVRLKGKPLAKIIKNWDFYGLEFKVNKNVLTPRQETELLVEQVINDFKTTNNKNILDLCTGSGAIAVTLKNNLKAKITASDISKKALRIAKYNAKKHEVDIKFVKSDLLKNIEGKFSAIVSNPPYIKSEDISSLQTEVKKYDPHLALDGGEDGLKFYKEIIKLSPQKLNKNGKIYLELGINQAGDVKKLLQKDFADIKVIKDYNNIERIITARRV